MKKATGSFTITNGMVAVGSNSIGKITGKLVSTPFGTFIAVKPTADAESALSKVSKTKHRTYREHEFHGLLVMEKLGEGYGLGDGEYYIDARHVAWGKTKERPTYAKKFA